MREPVAEMVPGEYAAALRAVGDFLDLQFASCASIANDDRAVVIMWHTPGGAVERRRYLQYDLAELSRQAHRQRGSALTARLLRARLLPDSPRQSDDEDRGELLRTLGQNLDQEGIQVDGIMEAASGYRVLGSHDGRPVDRFYTTSELSAASRERRALRAIA